MFLPVQNPDEPFEDLIANETIFKSSAEEIAEQLTLVEWNLFVRIMPHEVLNQSWTKKDAHIRSPNITALSRRFNSVAQWVVSSILCLKTAKLRGERISKIVDVANVNYFNSDANSPKKLFNFDGNHCWD
jgi:hypothetical protein